MQETIRFTVYGEPKTAGSKRAFYNKKIKRAIVTDDNAKSRDWKEQVASTSRQAYDGALLEGPLVARFWFYRPRPGGHFGASGAMNKKGRDNPAPATKPDVLKLARCAEDALKGVLYRDDSQIVDERIVKRWGEPARLEVEISAYVETEQLKATA